MSVLSAVSNVLFFDPRILCFTGSPPPTEKQI